MGLPHTDNRFYEKRHKVLFRSFYQHLKTLIDLFCSDRVFKYQSSFSEVNKRHSFRTFLRNNLRKTRQIEPKWAIFCHQLVNPKICF